MKIKKISVTNLRCFKKERSILLAQPNGKSGSGLTILIGENGSGKTTVLEAINLLTLNKFVVQNSLTINDFSDFKKEIRISAEIPELECKSTIDFLKDYKFKASGVDFSAKSRQIKERNKLLSDPFELRSRFVPKGPYIKPGGKSGNAVDSRDLTFSNNQVHGDELNIFYFDKNRTRQISTGNYKTTLERIFDDLNWKFIKMLDDSAEKSLIDNISGEYFKQVETIINGSPGSKLGEELNGFFDNNEYTNLKVDLVNLLHPFTNSSFVIREADEITQKTIRNLGSGVEMILTILLLRIIAKSAKGSIMLLIDEPEIHLHPNAQERLLELLLEESKDKQVVISTHSPYMFKGVFSTEAKLLLFSKQETNENIEVTNAKSSKWGLFGRYSPTWGEINYFAYNLPTVEFHNELYGYLQAVATEEDEDNYHEENFDKYMQKKLGKGAVMQKWIKKLKTSNVPCYITQQTYIRNSIHHPENRENMLYTPAQLRASTEQLVDLMRS